MKDRTVVIDGNEEKVTVELAGGQYLVARGDRENRIRVIRTGPEEIELDLNGAHLIVPFVRDGAAIRFQFRGEQYTAEISTPGRKKKRGREQSTAAPMPGTVVKIFVAVGDVVQKGRPLLILEAMKMEHQISAPSDGTVREIRCKAGEMVQPGVELIDIENQEPA